MASQTTTSTLSARIDDVLTFLKEEWADLPGAIADWNAWSEEERLDFVAEWTMCDESLVQLERWVAQDTLTANQRADYEALRQLMEQHRPALDRLLVDVAGQRHQATSDLR